MIIQSPVIGPIVGYTSPREARIWQKGKFEPTPGGYRRSFGVTQVSEHFDGWTEKTGTWSAPVYVKLPPYFDMSGVCVMQNLRADTVYHYRSGWFFADAELDDFLAGLVAPATLEWNNAFRGTFRTASADKAQGRSYVLGSCRYLLRLFGGTIGDERGDKAFRSIVQQIDKGTRTDALMMIGDQIYADDLNFLAPDTRLDQFLDRYRAAFGQEHLGRLMSRVPTYMILDDHEIEDNWPANATEKDRLTLYPHAIHAYQIYQCSHSPIFDLDSSGQLTGTLTRLWYSFSDGCCDCFVMDTRTERVSDEDQTRRRMINDRQMKALLDWLGDGSGRVKLVVTSVPFVPDLRSDSEDKWGAYPRERAQILDHILAKKVRKVVFLSGDVHCSFSVELTSPADPAFKVISIVSSSFFWPYPHMDESDFMLAGDLVSGSANTYTVGNPSAVRSDDNFTRLEVTPGAINVLVYDRKGAPLGPAKLHAF